MPGVETPEALVARCQQIMAHAWMVRTFVKHCEEMDDYPELMGIVRTVFDAYRALESKADNPADYFKMLSKKIGRLRQGSEEFARQAAIASEHTNFQQAVISINVCVSDLTQLLNESKSIIAPNTSSSSLEPPA